MKVKTSAENILKAGEDALVLIGPEGDFSEEEVKKLSNADSLPLAWENHGFEQRQQRWWLATQSTY